MDKKTQKKKNSNKSSRSSSSSPTSSNSGSSQNSRKKMTLKNQLRYFGKRVVNAIAGPKNLSKLNINRLMEQMQHPSGNMKSPPTPPVSHSRNNEDNALQFALEMSKMNISSPVKKNENNIALQKNQREVQQKQYYNDLDQGILSSVEDYSLQEAQREAQKIANQQIANEDKEKQRIANQQTANQRLAQRIANEDKKKQKNAQQSRVNRLRGDTQTRRQNVRPLIFVDSTLGIGNLSIREEGRIVQRLDVLLKDNYSYIKNEALPFFYREAVPGDGTCFVHSFFSAIMADRLESMPLSLRFAEMKRQRTEELPRRLAEWVRVNPIDAAAMVPTMVSMILLYENESRASQRGNLGVKVPFTHPFLDGPGQLPINNFIDNTSIDEQVQVIIDMFKSPRCFLDETTIDFICKVFNKRLIVLVGNHQSSQINFYVQYNPFIIDKHMNPDFVMILNREDGHFEPISYRSDMNPTIIKNRIGKEKGIVRVQNNMWYDKPQYEFKQDDINQGICSWLKDIPKRNGSEPVIAGR